MRIVGLGLAMLAMSGIVAAQAPPAKGSKMAQNDPVAKMTEEIQARYLIPWEAWKNKDEAANSAVHTDDFKSIGADGVYQTTKPTVQQMIDQAIVGYKISEFRVVPEGQDAALVTYFAEITTPDKAVHHMAAAESWVKRKGQWFVRAFSGTMMK